MTPKLFQYSITKAARADMQHIVLPEGDDKRVVSAAGLLARCVIGQRVENNPVVRL
jgi:phosphate acetyltransferase